MRLILAAVFFVCMVAVSVSTKAATRTVYEPIVIDQACFIKFQDRTVNAAMIKTFGVYEDEDRYLWKGWRPFVIEKYIVFKVFLADRSVLSFGRGQSHGYLKTMEADFQVRLENCEKK